MLALGGIGAGVANAATTTDSPEQNASVSDTATPGDTPDAADHADGPGEDVQNGDQSTPDVPEAAETPEAPGA